MRVIRECDRIDYMNSIPLHGFISENVVVECKKFVYIAVIIRMSSEALRLSPIQQTDAERYGFDPRVFYVRRDDMHNSSPMVSHGYMNGSIHGNMQGRDNYHIDEVGAYPSCPPEPQQVSQSYTWNSSTSWVSPYAEEQPVENTPELEREYVIFRRIYNRIRI